MHRSCFVDRAVLLATLVLAFGCGAEPSSPPQNPAPLVLAELRAASPGPWRHHDRQPISVTSLDRTDASHPPPAELNTAGAGDLEPRWSDQSRSFPQVAPPDVQPARERPAQTPLDDAPNQPAAVPHSQQGATRVIGKPRPLAPFDLSRQTAAPLSPAVTRSAGQRATLPWAYSRRRTPQTDSTVNAAGNHVRNGLRLAERNALYLAQAEFLAALELVAEANDAQQNTRFYSNALNAGLLALAESDDFVAGRPAGQRLDVVRIVSDHKTPILKNPPLNHLAPTVAAKRYHTYAREQLAAAAALEANGSMALFGLGKMALAIGSVSPARRPQSTDQAAALYQASLMVDAENFRAARELGMILARQGELARARDLLAHSARLAPHPATHRTTQWQPNEATAPTSDQAANDGPGWNSRR